MSALDDLLHKKPQDLSDLQTVVINSVLGIASTAMAEAAAAQLAQKDEEIVALKADITLREQAQRGAVDALRLARKVLQDIEYIDVDGKDDEVYPMCPRCGNGTHRKDCELKAALAALSKVPA